MNTRHCFAVLAAALVTFVSGCAPFSDTELGRIRQSGVSPRVSAKFREGRILTTDDVIELTRHGVPDDLIVREINDAGVDYVVHRDDLKRLEQARVSRSVMEALIAASDEYSARYSPARRAYIGYGPYPYDPYYVGPYPSPYYYPYGGVTVEVGGGRYWGGGHGHHWH